MSYSSIELPKVLGSAEFVGLFENGSDAWHEARAVGVGGSEVGTICGLNKWESAYTLWAKKLGKIPSAIPQSEPMEWGSRLESVILDKFVDTHPELEVWGDAGTWKNVSDVWANANPDGVYKREDGSYGIVEIKTAAYPDDWEIGLYGVVGSSSGVPRYYLTQVQHYLRVFGFKEAIVCALFTGNKYREYLVEADEFQQSIDREQILKFLDCVESDVAPSWDGSKSTYETVRDLHPEIEDSAVELGDLGREYVAALGDYDFANNAVTMLKTMILDNMGHAKKGLLDGDVIVTRQAGRGGASPFLVNKKGKN